MTTLHLHVKGKYFDEISCGEKLEEFRLVKSYWKSRLIGNKYQWIIIHHGYPKKGDIDRFLVRPYEGYKMKTIQHEEFGDKPVSVFAIKVNEEPT